MSEERRELRSWRERLATPLKGPAETVSVRSAPTEPTKRQNPDSLRVGSVAVALDRTPVLGDTTPVLGRPRLVRIGPSTWQEAEWARGLCVYCPAPVAPGDLIACREHRQKIDAIVMPWDRRD